MYAITLKTSDNSISVRQNVSKVTVNHTNQNINVQHTGRGPQGAVGPQGPQGIPGATTGDLHYEQSFTVVDTVTVNHNLGKKPAVTIIDTANDEVEGTVEHISVNQLTVSFNGANSGIITCN